ncbi:MAG TPA: hypothetical protein VHE54_10345 [Puia sp.]|nr:hypothetical protein [Puia sp.]
MRKINRLSQLRSEQLRLVRRRYDLESDIRRDWSGLRHHLEGASLARGALWSGIGWLGRRLFPTERRRGAGEHSHAS